MARPRIFIVCGTTGEFINYVKENRLNPRECKRIFFAYQLRGLRLSPDQVRWVGGYESLPNYLNIRKAAEQATAPAPVAKAEA